MVGNCNPFFTFFSNLKMTYPFEIESRRECEPRRKRLTPAAFRQPTDTPWISAVSAAMTVWVCCMTVAPVTDAAEVDSLADLPAVVARVNGEAVPKTVVVPAAGETIAEAVRRAVDQALIAQLFVKEGLDKDPNYQRQVKRVRRLQTGLEGMEIALLARFYEQRIPELAAKPDPNEVTEAEIDEWLKGDRAILGSLTGEKAREAARGFVVREQAARTRGEALQARLSKTDLRADGELIAQSVVDQDIAAIAGRRIGSREQPKSLILDKIREMVISREAKQRGVESETIAKDAAFVKKLVDGVTIEVAGDAFVLGDYPGGVRAPVAMLGQRLLAAEAKENGIDRDPEFQKQLEKSRPPARLLSQVSEVDIYFSHHGLGETDITDDELDAWYLAVMRALLNWEGEQNSLRGYLQAAKLRSQKVGYPKIAAVAISDAELDAWCLALMRGIVNGEKGSFRNYLQSAKLQWQREGYLEGLRTAAKIEYLVDL